MEHLLDQTAITYPYTTVTEMTGGAIKNLLEDIADNLFNPDPYYQQGGDMVRVGGLQYACDPTAGMGRRISDLDAERQAARRRPEIQGRRMGAGVGGGEAGRRRAGVGADGALSARAEGHQAAYAELARLARESAGNPGLAG